MVLAAGAHAVGADFQNLEVKNHAPLDGGTTTSTSFTTTRSGATSPVGVAFTAPPSGKVEVSINAALTSSAETTSSYYTLVGYQIRTGSTLAAGTVIESPSDALTIQHFGSNTRRYGMTHLIDGLGAGSSFNITCMYRVGTASNTGDINRIELIIRPCIA
jgi:hypothetical protein